MARALALIALLLTTATAAADDAKTTPRPHYVVTHELKGHTKLVRCVAFRPGTHLLASGGSDRSIRFWDADKGKPVGEHILPRGG